MENKYKREIRNKIQRVVRIYGGDLQDINLVEHVECIVDEVGVPARQVEEATNYGLRIAAGLQ